MHPVVNAQLTEFANTQFIGDIPVSDQFEIFSIFAVVQGLLSRSTDAHDLHLKGTEFGIDGAGVLIQGDACTNSDDVVEAFSIGKRSEIDFVFTQSKTSEKSDYGELCKFLDAVLYFFTDQLRGKSVQLDDLSDAKDAVYANSLKQNPSLYCYFVHTGPSEISTEQNARITASYSALSSLNIFDEISIKVIGAKEVQDDYRRATNSISETIEFPKSLTLPEHPSVEEAHVGYVPASEIVKLATVQDVTDGSRAINPAIFFDNIRDFNEKSKINQTISADIKSGDVKSFVFKNNGVTVVARHVHRTSDRFTLSDY